MTRQVGDPVARREIGRLREKHGLSFTPTRGGGELSHPTQHGRCQLSLSNDRADLATLLAWLRGKGLEPPAAARGGSPEQPE